MAERAKFTKLSWQFKMVAAAILNFKNRKNVSISGSNKDISTKFGGQMQHGHTEIIL